MSTLSRPLIPAGGALAVLAAALVVLFTCTAAGIAGEDRLADLSWMTEEYYPYSFIEDGRVQGISADLLRLTWARMGEPQHEIRSYPWARAYHFAQTEPNTVLFSMARIPEREDLFLWAGPIATVRFVLVAKKSRGLEIESGEDLKGLTIGTLRQDVGEMLLAPWRELCTIEPVANMEQNLRKLQMGRLDLVSYEENSMHLLLLHLGMSPDDYETVFVLRETPTYYAFHRDTDPTLVARFQDAIEQVKADTSFTRLLDRYVR